MTYSHVDYSDDTFLVLNHEINWYYFKFICALIILVLYFREDKNSCRLIFRRTDCCSPLQDKVFFRLHPESDRTANIDLEYKRTADISLNVSLSLSLPSWSFPFRKHSLFFHSSHFCVLKIQSILPASFSLFLCLFLSFKLCVPFTSQGTRKKNWWEPGFEV